MGESKADTDHFSKRGFPKQIDGKCLLFYNRKLNYYIEMFIDFIDGALLKGSWSRGNLPRLPVDSTCQHIFHLEQSIS